MCLVVPTIIQTVKDAYSMVRKIYLDLLYTGILYTADIVLKNEVVEITLLEMSCKICQDHARLTRTNVQKSYKNILARS